MLHISSSYKYLWIPAHRREQGSNQDQRLSSTPAHIPAVLLLPGNSTATRVTSTWLSEYDHFKRLQILRKLVSVSRSFPTSQLNSTIHRTPRTPSLLQGNFLYFLTEDANLRGRPKSQKRKRPVLPLGRPPLLLPRPLSLGPSPGPPPLNFRISLLKTLLPPRHSCSQT